MTDVINAAEELLKACDQLVDDSAGIFAFDQDRLGPYQGKQIDEEMKALRAAIAAHEQAQELGHLKEKHALMGALEVGDASAILAEKIDAVRAAREAEQDDTPALLSLARAVVTHNQLPPVDEQAQLTQAIRIAIWNARKWQGAPDGVIYSLINRVMQEPALLSALQSRGEVVVRKSRTTEPVAWTYEQREAVFREEPVWVPIASTERPPDHPRIRNIRPLYASPPADGWRDIAEHPGHAGFVLCWEPLEGVPEGITYLAAPDLDGFSTDDGESMNPVKFAPLPTPPAQEEAE